MPPTNRRAMHKAILETPWALLPSVLRAAVERSRMAGPVQHLDGQLLAMDGPHEGAARIGSVSIIAVYGVIENHSDWFMEMFGDCVSVDSLRQTLSAELGDPNVRAVILEIDSPGGTVAGVTELAAEIRAVRGGQKPIIAVANTTAASAAYWIGSQADEFVVTPSGQVGSIGVYAVHQEVSRMLEEMGVATTLISAGPYKTEGNEYEPLTDAAKADIQGRVDAAYTQFVADVAAGRRVSVDEVVANYGGGRVLVAKDAKTAGMVDRIETLAQTVQRLNRAAGSAGPRRARAMLLELEAAAIGRHTTETTDDAWDGNAAEANLPSGDGAEPALRKAHAWVDDAGDPNLKTSYKFIHHEVADSGTVGAANVSACSTGIGYLNREPGAPGRPDIPDADRAGVHRHLAGHMLDAGMTPAPMMGQAPFTERLVALALEATELVDHAQERARLRAKEGRPAFSTTTERSLRAIRDAVDDLLEPDDPAPGDPPEGPVEPAPKEPIDPPAVAVIPRFKSRADFLRHLETTRH